jgi:hypothetical protein
MRFRANILFAGVEKEHDLVAEAEKEQDAGRRNANNHERDRHCFHLHRVGINPIRLESCTGGLRQMASPKIKQERQGSREGVSECP